MNKDQKNTSAGLPDITLSVRETFGFDSDLEVPAQVFSLIGLVVSDHDVRDSRYLPT